MCLNATTSIGENCFSVFYIFFVFNFDECSTVLVVPLSHHFIFVSTFGGDGASDRCVRDLAPFRHILNDVSNDFRVELVFRRFARFDERCGNATRVK